MLAGAGEAAAALAALIGRGDAPSGSLRVFGDWFGRPEDNWHRPVTADSSGWCLTVNFDGGETLRVWDPVGVEVTRSVFRIRVAQRVRWEWFAYGNDRTPANLFVEEHWIEDGTVRATSSATWYQPSFQPSLTHPAVELA